MDLLRRRITALCTGWEVAQIRAIVAETLHEIVEPLVYAEATELIAEHRAHGDEVVVLSASGLEVVEPIAALVGADRCQATRMGVTDGRYSGVIEYYCYGEAKAQAARDIAAEPAATGWRTAGPTPTRSPICRCWRPSGTHGGQPGPGAAAGGRGARLAGADVRRTRWRCAPASAGPRDDGVGGRPRRRCRRRWRHRRPRARALGRWCSGSVADDASPSIVRIGGVCRCDRHPPCLNRCTDAEALLWLRSPTTKRLTDSDRPGAVRQRSTRPPRSGSVREDRALHAQHAAGGMSSWACVPGRRTPRPQHDT